MWVSFEKFCEQNGLSANESDLCIDILPDWKQIFETYISKDISFKEKDPVKLVRQYYQSTKDYIEFFLLHVHDDLIEPVPEWNNDNAIHFATKHGYHYFLDYAYKEYCLAHPDVMQNAINIPNQYGMRALHLASSAGHFHTVTVLLEFGADATLGNTNNCIPIEFAAKLPIRCSAELKAKKESILNLLISNSPQTVRYTNLKYETIVHLLAGYGYTSLLENLILKDRTLLRLADAQQHRPIHHAILNNRFETVSLLLSLANSDDESLVGFEGQRPIHYAALRGTEDMVRLCCEKCPQDIKKLDYLKRSALDIALIEHNDDAQKVLRSYYSSNSISTEENLLQVTALRK